LFAIIFKQEQKTPRRVTFARFVLIKEIEEEEDEPVILISGLRYGFLQTNSLTKCPKKGVFTFLTLDFLEYQVVNILKYM
jgi:hypothetical protein